MEIIQRQFNSSSSLQLKLWCMEIFWYNRVCKSTVVGDTFDSFQIPNVLFSNKEQINFVSIRSIFVIIICACQHLVTFLIVTVDKLATYAYQLLDHQMKHMVMKGFRSFYKQQDKTLSCAVLLYFCPTPLKISKNIPD